MGLDSNKWVIYSGALIKPWIFDEIKQQRHWDISSKERFEMLKRFCDYGLEHWGTDSQVNDPTRYRFQFTDILTLGCKYHETLPLWMAIFFIPVCLCEFTYDKDLIEMSSYIPAGLLEVLPQRINERAPPFRGRDELEDLMASPRASDWVKLR